MARYPGTDETSENKLRSAERMRTTKQMNTTTTKALNRKERRAMQLLAHYSTCEALGKLLGMKEPNGKKISVALFKLEQHARLAAEAYCNGERCVVQLFMQMAEDLDFRNESEAAWNRVNSACRDQIYRIFGKSILGFFVNGDARGYALKIDDQSPLRDELLRIGMQRDMGGYFILSPEITGA